MTEIQEKLEFKNFRFIKKRNSNINRYFQDTLLNKKEFYCRISLKGYCSKNHHDLKCVYKYCYSEVSRFAIKE